MKKILVFLCIMASVLSAMAQVVTLRFTGTDRTRQDYVRLHHVSIYDNDQLWHQVIYYPDTTLSLYDRGALGIEENNYDTSLKLYQNTPNPFSGSTDVMLATAEEGAVTLEVADMQGRIVVNICLQSLLPGSHQFNITLATSGTYVMTARQNGKLSSIKMVCNAGGGSNAIAHIGSTDNEGTISVFLKNMAINGSYPFKNGDRMSYRGYAMIDATERASIPVECEHQWQENTSYYLKFDVARPAVTTFPNYDATPYAATVNGEVTADNNALVTERGFCWLSGTEAPTIADNCVRVGDGVGTFSATIPDNLIPGTIYSVRAYAINAIGISYGDIVVFVTPSVPPIVVTNDATELTVSSATLNGEVSYNGGASVTARGFKYGTDADNLVASVSLGTGTGTISTTISNLVDNTTYFYRAYATNSAGTAYGEIKSFTTVEILLPSITTLQATDITRTSLTLNASIMSDGGSAVTACGFYWGSAEDNLPNYVESEQMEADFFATIGNLTPNTIYYYRAVVSNVRGTALGEVLSAQTNPLTEPIVVTNDVTNITSNSAVLNGSISDDGGSAITVCGFYWGTDDANLENNAISSGTANDFTANLTGLTSATTYYVRAYATNSLGTAYGEQKTFTTLDFPTITTTVISNITSTSANSGGNVTSDGDAAVTARGVCWSTSQNPTIADSHTTDGAGTGSFASEITDLLPGTTYYVRAYATNIVGTAYGEQREFTTEIELPTITTAEVSNVTSTAAISGGNVTSNGGANVIARGVCWSTSQNPTISNSHTTNGTGTGSFTSSISGLTPGTIYYVRAYATNIVGTAYGEQKTFTTLELPTVATIAVSDITGTTATSGGNVTSDGGATVTARGVCWSTSQNPTISDSHTTNGTGLGSFSSSITGLSDGTIYYVRAYATNSVGTAYGNEVAFAAECQCGEDLYVTDIDGNRYGTVLIGEQCWMAQNLKTTKFADGTNIPLGSSSSTTTAYRYRPNGSSSNVSTYGYLYNWPAAMHGASSSSTNPSNVQGVCPTGWHLPSDAEWTQLTNYVSSQSEYLCDGFGIAKSLASTTGWNSSTTTCAVGNTQSTNNSTGFNARPASYYYGYYDDLGTDAYFWSTTEYNSNKVYFRNLSYYLSDVTRLYYDNDKYYGMSVRCVRNAISVPTVTTTAVSDITGTTASCGGNVTSDGGTIVSAYGVCWGTSQYPTVSGNHTIDGSGTGSFNTSITGLTPGTTYYIRAYATNSGGTAYGLQKTFTTLVLPTVTTAAVSNTTGTTATSGGSVSSSGGNTVTARGVCWSTSQNPTIADSHTTDGTGTGSFISNITGLSPVTTYYVRAYATNAAGTAYGEQKTFTTEAILPTVTTATILNIATTTATSGGNVTSDGGAVITARGVCWSTSQNPTISNSHTTNGTGTGSFTSSISGLTPGTTYYLRAYATNSIGTAYGEQRTFTTQDIPTVLTLEATGITDQLATLTGNVTSDGGASVTVRGFLYGTSADNLSEETQNGSNTGSYTTIIAGLTPSTTYYYKAYATNSVGTAFGELLSFTTLMLPVVTTSDVSDIASATATCGGNVTSDGGAAITARGVCWSTTQEPTIADSHTTDGTGTGSFISNITGLSPVTTYYVRAYATNAAGTAYGEVMQFTTEAIEPSVLTISANSITSSGATLIGSVTSNGGATVTARGFMYGTSASNLTQTVQSGTGTGNFAKVITGLTHSTTYYYKAYATNSVGTAYGEVMQFTTEAILPIVQTVSATGITYTGATLVGNVIYDGGATVTARGFVYGASASSLTQTILQGGTGTGNFAKAITGLTHSTTYYYKAYATNSVGTSYGEVMQFTTSIPVVPMVQTLSATNITYEDATLNGNITSDGGADVTERGFMYGTSESELSQTIQNGSGTGSFTETLIGLTASTTYYYKAYATNSVGTTYGEVMQFTTSLPVVPTVQTLSATNITYEVATLNGNVTSDGGAAVTACGFVYGTSESSLTQAVTCDLGTGNFAGAITGLTESTIYYYKAYATNSAGTSYGDVLQFTTRCECGGSYKVTDIDGNQYSTILIGEQCWMAENLKATKFADGTSIPLGSSTSSTTAYRYNPNNSSSNVSTYGYLYNWPAAMHGASSSNTNPSNRQGVCPIGWHLPSDAEWIQLTNYLKSQSLYQCGDTSINIAKSLASTTGWNSSTDTCAVGNTPSDNNSTGFSGLPAGYYSGSYSNFGDLATFWSATTYNSTLAYERRLHYNYANVLRYYYNKNNGRSVRCVRDNTSSLPPSVPSVTTTTATSIINTSAKLSGNVTTDGGAAVTERGFMYGTSEGSLNQTIQCGSGTGSYAKTLTGLAESTTYYYKAYATNSVGTSYGDVMSFTTITTTGTLNGHDWVDLGLPSGTRWATCNVGASTPTAYGKYYCWGETTTQTWYNYSTYTYSGNPTTLPSSADAATANWGSGWRMPTYGEMVELINRCTVTWTTQNGVYGYLFRGQYGNSIFLPAAGYKSFGELNDAGSEGKYWSSSLNTDATGYAWILLFDSGESRMSEYGNRGYGFTVRAVCQP